VIDDLRELVERMPVPGGDWHPHAATIRRFREDVLRDLDRLAADPAAAARLEALLDAVPDVPVDVPVPEGEHPYLDEIRPVIEVARLVRATLGA
jgi:hypothetical protein